MYRYCGYTPADGGCFHIRSNSLMKERVVGGGYIRDSTLVRVIGPHVVHKFCWCKCELKDHIFIDGCLMSTLRKSSIQPYTELYL